MKKTLSLFFLSALISFFPMESMSQNIYKNKSYKWKGNEIIQGKFKAKAISPTHITSNYEPTEVESQIGVNMPTGIDRKNWVLKKDISKLPQYKADNVLENALYNMTLEESILAIEPDSTFRTGIFWGGVWTRDVSYSILHSLAQLHPQVSKNSLLAKVNANNRIIQDTGTGGAWPCSTDRVTWVLAAWEIYKVTGDKEWLDRIYPIIRNTVEDDMVVAFDPKTQLIKGETSYMDWREQEYPIWAQPADIFNGESLITSAVHYQITKILSCICELEGQPGLAKRYANYASKIKDGINKQLWMEDKGYYAIYLYGRNNLVLHPQMEVLGEAFSILFDIADADRAKIISQAVEHEDFGSPCMFPNLKDQYPYHNDAMWPFVQGYWMKATAKAGNEASLLHSIATLNRCGALFLTNQENMVIYNGDYKGLPINSPRQLWSVAAAASIVPNIYFGINYEVDGISFKPFVPKVLKGNRELKNFKYRKASLNLSINGFGNHIKTFKLDGVETKPFFPGNLTGEHTIEMTLDNVQPAPMNVTYKENAYQPNTPKTTLNGNKLTWEAVENASEYIVLKNGKEMKHQTDLSTTLEGDAEYAVLAVSPEGYRGYMSEPVRFYSHSNTYEVEDYALVFDPTRKTVKESVGTGSGVVNSTQEESTTVPTLAGADISGATGKVSMITRNDNILITIPVEVKADGRYAIDWRYANGSGPITTENKCATRLLKVNGETIGVSVFPHRGADEWNNWGWSNPVVTNLKKGKQVITLEFDSHVENMNITVNQALLDQMRLTKID
jgi:hypothetical protein